jgi:uncharacterized protein (DUF2236 family)
VQPVGEAERDRYCAEAASTAVALGAVDAAVPRTWSAAQAHLEEGYRTGVAVVTEPARRVAQSVLSPPFAPLLGPVSSINRVLTFGLLPPYIRDQYGYRWHARHQRTFDRLARTIRGVRRVTPERLALWPEARRHR